MIGGWSQDASDIDFAVARLNTDGTLDSSFGGGDGIATTPIGTATDWATGMTLQADGKIVLAGYSQTGTDRDIAVVRYNADGSLDTSFGGGDGIVLTSLGTDLDRAFQVTQQSDGKLIVVGQTDSKTIVLRYNTDGTLDSTFASSGVYEIDLADGDESARSVSIDSDDKIVVFGQATIESNQQLTLIRLNADGTPDTGFDSFNNDRPTYTENGTPVVLDGTVEVFDAELSDSDNFDGSTLTLARNLGPHSDDVYSAVVAGTLNALTEGGSLVVDSTTIGTVTTNSAGTLVLTFNSNATNALVNSAMQQIAYSSSSEAPPASVQIDWTFNDGNTADAQGTGPAEATIGSTTVNITAVNDAPVADTIEATELAYSETDGSVIITNTISFTDVDDTHIELASVRITSGFVSGEDILVFKDQNGIQGTYFSSIGLLRLTGTATLEEYETAIRSVTYGNTSEAPVTTTRTVSFSVNDGDATSNTLTRDIAITAVNDGPAFDLLDDLSLLTLGAVSDEAQAVLHQPDGKIIVVGSSNSGTSNDLLLLRFNTDGSLDTTFGGGDGFVTTDFSGGDDFWNDVQLDSNGKILAAGYVTDGGREKVAIARYNTDGTLDLTYGGGDGIATIEGISFPLFANSLAIQVDGEAIIAGTGANSGDFFMIAARFDTDGVRDPNFGNGGGLATFGLQFGIEQLDGIEIQTDGKILLAGRSGLSGSETFTLLRLETDGSLDTTFGGGDGEVTTPIGLTSGAATSLVFQSDQKIVLVGYVESGSERDIALVRYNTDGTLDTTFGGGDGIVTTELGSAEDDAYDVVQQPLDGKLIVVGKTATATVVLRYNTDGSLDTSFATGGVYEIGLGTADEQGFGVSIDENQKIVVVGSARSDAGDQLTILRLNNDGTRDTSLDVNDNDGPTFIEDGPAVILDADVEIFDAELSDVDNFDGSSLTLTRDGGANSEDILSFEDGPAITLSGGELFKNSAVSREF